MPGVATSFASYGHDARRVAGAVRDSFRRVRAPAGAVLFASGELGGKLPELAAELADPPLGFPVLMAAGGGVLTERGEIEGQSAAAALCWSGGSSSVHSLATPSGEGIGIRLLQVATGEPHAALLFFMRADRFFPQLLEPLRQATESVTILGGGAAGDKDVVTLGADGEVSVGAAGLMALRGISNPHQRAANACRLITPFRRITQATGRTVFRIDDEPALEALAAVGRAAGDRELVLIAIADADHESSEFLVRSVHGVDPDRGGLVISEEARVGRRLAFAMRDPTAARTNLEAATRDIQRATAGAAPRFCLYVNCAGRGTRMYGAQDVDTRILRSRFGDIPICGINSAFEIAPFGERPSVQLFNGVVTLFTAAS
jgi:small ligand-binding sensory domain FIST